jgi:hypothetical protein
VVEEVLRVGAEDDATRLPDERHRTERDQPVAGADVEDHLAGADASILQHSIRIGSEELERPSFCSASPAWLRANTPSAH